MNYNKTLGTGDHKKSEGQSRDLAGLMRSRRSAACHLRSFFSEQQLTKSGKVKVRKGVERPDLKKLLLMLGKPLELLLDRFLPRLHASNSDIHFELPFFLAKLEAAKRQAK